MEQEATAKIAVESRNSRHLPHEVLNLGRC
jgi:hypothetical protein